MFGRKRKGKHVLRIYDGEGRALFDGEPGGFELEEAQVLRLSEGYFGDPEPCHIHRAAVHGRAWLELCEGCEGRGRLAVNGLSEGLRAHLGHYPGAEWIEIF